MFCMLFFFSFLFPLHNLFKYCRQIKDTIAECNIEMHKKHQENRDTRDVYFCCFIECDVKFLKCCSSEEL